MKPFDESAVEELVLRAVMALRPLDAREATSLKFAVEQLKTLERPFDRNANLVHVTGSAVVIGRRGVLLHRHKKLKVWLQPGGHIDAGEAPWEAARREAEEETGLRFLPWSEPPDLLHVDVHPGGAGHTHLDLRYALSVHGDSEPAPGPGESQEVRWFGWQDALTLADPGLRGLLAALRPSGSDPSGPAA